MTDLEILNLRKDSLTAHWLLNKIYSDIFNYIGHNMSMLSLLKQGFEENPTLRDIVLLKSNLHGDYTLQKLYDNLDNAIRQKSELFRFCFDQLRTKKEIIEILKQPEFLS